MSKKRDRLTQTVNEAIGDDDVYLYWLDWGKQGERWVLEVTIDREDREERPITTTDCVTVSRKVSRGLDRSDLIERSYELQVSSPGIERRLRRPYHYELVVGELVEVKTFAKVDGRKKFVGTLLGYDEDPDEIRLDFEGEELALSRENITRAITKEAN